MWYRHAADKPSHRVKRALGRITRDRWISGEGIRHICHELSKCACPQTYGNGWSNVYKFSMPGECEVIGMWRGEPPSYIGDVDYCDMVRALQDMRTKANAKAELAILEVKLRNRRYAKQYENTEC